MGLELAAVRNDLPLSYRWFRGNGLKRLVPWHFGDDPAHIDGWRKEYLLEGDDTSDILPFAFRQDMDTMAGFVIIDGMILDHVMTTHLSWSGKIDMPKLRHDEKPAPLDLRQFPSFQDWFTTVMVRDSIEWTNEEDLDAIKSGTWPNFAP